MRVGMLTIIPVIEVGVVRRQPARELLVAVAHGALPARPWEDVGTRAIQQANVPLTDAPHNTSPKTLCV